MCRPIHEAREDKVDPLVPMRIEKGKRDLNGKERGRLLRLSEDKMKQLTEHDLQKRIQIFGCIKEVKKDICQKQSKPMCSWMWRLWLTTLKIGQKVGKKRAQWLRMMEVYNLDWRSCLEHEYSISLRKMAKPEGSQCSEETKVVAKKICLTK